MKNEIEIMQELLANYQMIKTIKNDDGYIIHRVATIGRDSIKLLNNLKIYNDDDTVIEEAISELKNIDSIEKSYYSDHQYKKWVKKENSFGNFRIFLEAINCVEGSLEVFLFNKRWLRQKN
ncbi:hypothetical protein ACR79B_05045 [Sphingobacterium spiritivorum]|uniref:hypothetical protein n=1 Tax=Sphingobacterium spiritivorum TaxID=258 RepID=UPI003DA6AD10